MFYRKYKVYCSLNTVNDICCYLSSHNIGKLVFIYLLSVFVYLLKKNRILATQCNLYFFKAKSKQFI